MAGRELDFETAVKNRYSAGAQKKERALCCPVNYRADLLAAIPAEIIELDYGCGDPSLYIREGETVIDLGSGGGKICYIAAQIVGPRGKVIGIDFNEDMLVLARKYRKSIGDKLGYHNVSFRKGKIQDLALDYDLVDQWLKSHPVTNAATFEKMLAQVEYVRKEQPMVRDSSINVVVSNCVLNLVKPSDKAQLFREIHRVLKRGGRAVISDIVSDEDVPVAMRADGKLWSGCVSGAFREDAFLRMFEEAGFYGMEILQRGEQPWRVVRGIEFRSMTVVAYKGKEGECWERNQAVVYQGPFREVCDDDGHRIRRGERTAVCDKTYQIFSREPYKNHFLAVPPAKEVPLVKATRFDCGRSSVRSPHETKLGMSRRSRVVGVKQSVNGNGCGPQCC